MTKRYFQKLLVIISLCILCLCTSSCNQQTSPASPSATPEVSAKPEYPARLKADLAGQLEPGMSFDEMVSIMGAEPVDIRYTSLSWFEYRLDDGSFLAILVSKQDACIVNIRFNEESWIDESLRGFPLEEYPDPVSQLQIGMTYEDIALLLGEEPKEMVPSVAIFEYRLEDGSYLYLTFNRYLPDMKQCVLSGLEVRQEPWPV